MPTFTLISQQLSEGEEPFVAAVDAALVALGAIGLQDVIVTRREGINKRPRMDVTLSHVASGPLIFRAAYFTAAYGQDVDVQANAFFAARPNARVHFVRDVGNDHRSSLNSDAVMVIYSVSPLPNCGYNRSRVIIVEALANIAAGASGQAQLVSADGLVTGEVISVVNRFDSQWDIGTRGYATPRLGTCVWDGYKMCC